MEILFAFLLLSVISIIAGVFTRKRANSKKIRIQKEQELIRADEHERFLTRQRELEIALDQEIRQLRSEKEIAQEHIVQENIVKEKKLETSLDWQKGKIKEVSATLEGLSSSPLQYRQDYKTINELIGLLFNMLSRGVEDLKIAQTIMYKNQGKSSESDIMELITSIKEFIALCKAKKFASFSEISSEEDALNNLSKGDNTYVLALLEKLMEQNIEKSLKVEGVVRSKLLQEASEYATIFGTIASLSDLELSVGSLELAIELNSENIRAWSRVADLYSRNSANKKAIYAYENLLKLADSGRHQGQIANAQKMLSHYYYEKGENLKAAKFYNESKSFYDSLGINKHLHKTEMEAVDVIEAQNENMSDIVTKLLFHTNIRSA